MANLAIQDTFEPYYAGRDGFAKKPARQTAEKPRDREKKTAIVVPASGKDHPRDGSGALEH